MLFLNALVYTYEERACQSKIFRSSVRVVLGNDVVPQWVPIRYNQADEQMFSAVRGERLPSSDGMKRESIIYSASMAGLVSDFPTCSVPRAMCGRSSLASDPASRARGS